MFAQNISKKFSNMIGCCFRDLVFSHIDTTEFRQTKGTTDPQIRKHRSRPIALSRQGYKQEHIRRKLQCCQQLKSSTFEETLQSETLHECCPQMEITHLCKDEMLDFPTSVCQTGDEVSTGAFECLGTRTVSS